MHETETHDLIVQTAAGETIVAGRVEEPVSESTHKVMAAVTGAELRQKYGRWYLPRGIEVTYKRSTGHAWRAGRVSLYGPQFRKDGTLGTREINETLWLRDGELEDGAPEWAREFYREHLPTD